MIAATLSLLANLATSAPSVWHCTAPLQTFGPHIQSPLALQIAFHPGGSFAAHGQRPLSYTPAETLDWQGSWIATGIDHTLIGPANARINDTYQERREMRGFAQQADAQTLFLTLSDSTHAEITLRCLTNDLR